MKRIAISKSIRFEVFKRDLFKCQYCGKSAPDVVLHIDHIQPIARGGSSDLLNLITACQPCNLGKGPREISDKSKIQKQRAELEALSERREQLKMMSQWREELFESREYEANSILEYWERVSGWVIESLEIKASIRALLARFEFDEVMVAMDIAVAKYTPSSPSEVEWTVKKIGGICYNRKFRPRPNMQLHTQGKIQ